VALLPLTLAWAGPASAAGTPEQERAAARRMEREADAVVRGSPSYDPGNPAFYRGQPAVLAWTLRRCAQGLPGVTPPARTCRAARAAAGEAR
jgi:hypothetical protein